jgi:hypothetical protein
LFILPNIFKPLAFYKQLVLVSALVFTEAFSRQKTRLKAALAHKVKTLTFYFCTVKKVHEKYLKYITFFNQWKALNKEDRDILEPYLSQLKREWERSVEELRLSPTAKRPHSPSRVEEQNKRQDNSV